MTGTWSDGGYPMSVGITITGVESDGRVAGCWWGWRNRHWSRADTAIGDPGKYDVADRQVDVFGKDGKAHLTGDRLVVTTRTGAIYDLMWSNNSLTGTVNWKRGTSEKKFIRISSTARVCP
jgi:hypothetical protein